MALIVESRERKVRNDGGNPPKPRGHSRSVSDPDPEVEVDINRQGNFDR